MDRAIGPPLTEAERALFLAELRKCMGIRFRHRGGQGMESATRHKVGLDCAGLLLRAMQRVGRPIVDLGPYAKTPAFDRLRQIVRANLGPPVAGPIQPSDLLLMRFSKIPQHVAVVGDSAGGGLSLIHTDATLGKVTEHRLDDYWLAGHVETYRL